MAKLYLEKLDNRFIKPVVDEDYFDVYHIFNIRYIKRDELKVYLLDNGIKTEIHYPLAPNEQKSMKEFISGNYPISKEIHNTTLSLPISYFHTKDDVKEVCEIINRFDIY